jgi:hypothetical protein
VCCTEYVPQRHPAIFPSWLCRSHPMTARTAGAPTTRCPGARSGIRASRRRAAAQSPTPGSARACCPARRGLLGYLAPYRQPPPSLPHHPVAVVCIGSNAEGPSWWPMRWCLRRAYPVLSCSSANGVQ